MNNLLLRRLFLPFILVIILAGTSMAQVPKIPGSKSPDRAMNGKGPAGGKKSKANKPLSAEMTKKEQEKNKKKQKKEYEKYVEANRKRSYDIQSPEVKARMKENEKDIAVREKEKKKKARSESKKAARKYS